MAEIKAVIFDWGGVLIDDPLPGLMQYCADALGVSCEDYIKAHNKFAGDFTRGEICEKTFWDKVCGALGKPVPKTTSLWGNAFRAAYRPRADMFSLVLSLHKAGYKTAFLSNTEVSSVEFFLSSFAGLRRTDTTEKDQLKYNQNYGKAFALTSMFDVLVFSCDEGTVKPERKIYEIAVERLGSRPEQTLFIDDKQEFINAARKIGLNTILFSNIKQLENELMRFGVQID
jgi:epoxide hydrolase-like predicted phosphatase